MTTAVLLHGAWHGGWCWAAVASALSRRGCTAVAPDLPAGEADAGLAAYTTTALAALAGAGPRDAVGDVVVVGHSLGGLVAPLVAERLLAAGRQVPALVLVCPLTPQPGVCARDQARAEPGIYTDAYRAARLVRHRDGATSMPPDVARELIYNDAPDEAAARAAALLRPQHWRMFFEASPLRQWPGAPTRILAARGDRLLGRAGMEAAARRLEVEITWLPGGHAPLLTQPEDLARMIVEC